MIEPTRKRGITRIVFGGGIVAALVFMALSHILPVHHDEAVYLTVAKSLLQGKSLYADVVDHKPPGIHLLLAWQMKFFGVSLWWIRISTMFVQLLTALLVWYFARRKDGSGALAAVIYLLLIPHMNGVFALPDVYMTAVLCIGYVALQSRRSMVGFLTGLCFGVSLLFKQTAVLYISVMLIDYAIQKSVTLKKLVHVAVGMLVVLLPVVYMAYASKNLIQAIEHILLYSSTEYIYDSFTQYHFGLYRTLLLLMPVIVVWGQMLLSENHEKTLRKSSLKYTTIALILILPVMIRPYHHYLLPILPIIAVQMGIHYTRYQSRVNSAMFYLALLTSLYSVQIVHTHRYDRIYQVSHVREERYCDFARHILSLYLNNCEISGKFYRL